MATADGGGLVRLDSDAQRWSEVERRREEESAAAPSALPRQRSAELEAELGRTRWAADSAMAAVKLLEQHALPRAESEVTPFLQTIYDTFSQFKPEADTVHSKCLDVATAGGDYFGIYILVERPQAGGRGAVARRAL